MIRARIFLTLKIITMKAEELRIGNLYMSVKFGVPIKWKLTDFTQLDKLSDGAYNDPPIEEMIKPIPLTEQWVLMFGFKNYYLREFAWKTKAQGKARRVRIEIQENGKCCVKGVGWIPYVHQLQNLYFSLVGEELTSLISNPL